ncbi:MAG: glycosyltransferase family 2 protein [Planctomycetota bacterium]
MTQPIDLSVVIPAYEEAATIGECVCELERELHKLNEPYEILVVDDGSTDGTFAKLTELRGEVVQLRALRFAHHRGQTAALDAGFRHARGTVVVTMDADMQNDPADIPKLLEALRHCDVACGVRVERRDGFVKRASSRVANWVRNKLSGEHIRDTGCSLKAYKRDFLVKLKLYDGMHRFLPTLLKMEGARVTEIPVNHRPRLKGRTKYNICNRVFKSFRDLFAVRWMKRRFIRYEIGEEF